MKPRMSRSVRTMCLLLITYSGAPMTRASNIGSQPSTLVPSATHNLCTYLNLSSYVVEMKTASLMTL